MLVLSFAYNHIWLFMNNSNNSIGNVMLCCCCSLFFLSLKTPLAIISCPKEHKHRLLLKFVLLQIWILKIIMFTLQVKWLDEVKCIWFAILEFYENVLLNSPYTYFSFSSFPFVVIGSSCSCSSKSCWYCIVHIVFQTFVTLSIYFTVCISFLFHIRTLDLVLVSLIFIFLFVFNFICIS